MYITVEFLVLYWDKLLKNGPSRKEWKTAFGKMEEM